MRQLRSAPVPAAATFPGPAPVLAAETILAAATLLLGTIACGGHTFDERLAEARRLRASGGAAEAAASLAEMSRDRPGDASLMYEQAQALHDAGKDDEALDRLTAALLAKPDLIDARVLRGVVLGSLGRDEEALKELRQVAATQPDRPGVHRAMGIKIGRASC